MEGKSGGIGLRFFPESCPPDTDFFGGKQIYSWNVLTLRSKAGQVLELQVAGQPRVKKVNEN